MAEAWERNQCSLAFLCKVLPAGTSGLSVTPAQLVTVAACGIANKSTCELLSHSRSRDSPPSRPIPPRKAEVSVSLRIHISAQRGTGLYEAVGGGVPQPCPGCGGVVVRPWLWRRLRCWCRMRGRFRGLDAWPCSPGLAVYRLASKGLMMIAARWGSPSCTRDSKWPTSSYAKP